MVQMDYAEKLQRCHGYVEALEDERRKIQVFQRELPLCLELVSQAIEACRRELSATATSEYMHGQSECSEQTSSEGPVLAEFIPIKKRSSSCSDYNDDNENNGEQPSHKRNRISDDGNNVKDQNNCDLKQKSEWLRSVQLWNQSPDPPRKEDVPRKVVVTEVKRNGGAFQPFHGEGSVGKNKNNQATANGPNAVPASATSSAAETVVGRPSTGGTSRKEESEGKEESERQQPQRKQRRCWSPELHRRFLSALQQLGGSHAATPKQIRELMKVDGLTNDEVKSHLQKYRLHTRRPSSTIHNNSSTPEAQQFVVVGGIWVPPPATITSGETATIATASGVCAPVAAATPAAPQVNMSSVQKPDTAPAPARSKKLQSEGRGSHSDGGSHSNSLSTSSFTLTPTNSPVF